MVWKKPSHKILWWTSFLVQNGHDKCSIALTYICIRVYHISNFFENFVGFFYFVYKYHEKLRKKIWGWLKVIWPPHGRVTFYIGKSLKIQRKFQKNRKHANAFEFLPNFLPLIDFWDRHDIIQYHLKAFYPDQCSFVDSREVKMSGIPPFWPNLDILTSLESTKLHWSG